MTRLTYPLLGLAVAVAPALVTDSPTAPVRRSRLGAPGRWAFTIAATGVSTWVLEVAATTAGVLLVASHLFHAAPHGLLIGFLAGTYLLWAAGLRVNLTANALLLETTGTSTNVLSKVSFEVARRRSCTQRCVRAASMTGYVVTEVAKEAPYYASAFGAALLSEDVNSADALIFLGGTNIGAACYECSVGRVTRTYLDVRSRRIARIAPVAGSMPTRVDACAGKTDSHDQRRLARRGSSGVRA